MAHKKSTTAARRKKASNKKAAQPLSTPVSFAANMPIHQALLSNEIGEDGIGHGLLARQLPNGNFAVAIFLIDIYCLGIRNVLSRVFSPTDYQFYVQQISSQEPLVEVAPAHLRKLVEGAEAYARKLGFKPHSDYAQARRLFGNIKVEECPTEFLFGREGKPLYIKGPQDSAVRSQQIYERLLAQCGEGGFEVKVNLASLMKKLALEEDEEGEDYEDDENSEGDTSNQEDDRD